MPKEKKQKEKKKPEDYKYHKRSFVVGKKEDGSQKRITVRGKTIREVENKLAEAKRLQASGLQGGEMTVREWSERWKKSYKTTVSDEQKNHYERKLRLDILPYIGDKRIKDVTKADLQGIMDSHESGRKGYVEKIKHAICLLFADAAYEGIIERDPSVRLELPEMEEEARRPLTLAEREALLKVAAEHKHGAYALTMLYTGIRRGECLALLRSDVDLEKQRMQITKAVDSRRNKPKLTGTKAANMRRKIKRGEDVGWRTVPIPDKLLPVMISLCNGKKPSDILFCNEDEKHASKSTSRRWWDSIKRQCHIAAGADLYRNAVQTETSPFDDKITAHYLRHTYATDMYAAGVDERARQEFLGHASPDVTNTYTAMSNEAFDRSAKQLNDYLNEEKWQPEETRRRLTLTERETFLRVAAKHPQGAYALTMLYTGMHSAECLALLRSDVDLNKKHISIKRIAGQKNYRAELKKEDRRIVPIPDVLLPTITALCENKDDDDILFPGANNTYASQISSRLWWHSIKHQCHISSESMLYTNTALVKTGTTLDDIMTIHCLRCTYAADIEAAGVDERTRQAFLGSMPSDVASKYSALSVEAIRRGSKQINDYLNGEKWRFQLDF